MNRTTVTESGQGGRRRRRRSGMRRISSGTSSNDVSKTGVSPVSDLCVYTVLPLVPHLLPSLTPWRFETMGERPCPDTIVSG